MQDIEPNDDERRLARGWAKLGHHTPENEKGYWQALANTRAAFRAKDTQLDFCDALMARCAKALAAADYALPGGSEKNAVRSCLAELESSGVDPETTSPFHDANSVAERRRGLLLVCLPALEILRKEIPPGTLPGLARIILKVEAETR